MARKVGPKILNFKDTVTSYDPSKFISEQYNCVCQNHPSFIEQSCGHIATGDLGIISNEKLRKLVLKGPGYKEPKSINTDNLYSSFDKDIKNFI